MTPAWSIRPYRPGDCPALLAVFRRSVYGLCHREYSPRQLDAWADAAANLGQWEQSLAAHHTLVAESGGQAVGFADLTAAGYLDHLYIHPQYTRQGIASALCRQLEAECRAPRLTTHASLTARPFFVSQGYAVVHREEVERCGVLLPRFYMEKRR